MSWHVEIVGDSKYVIYSSPDVSGHVWGIKIHELTYLSDVQLTVWVSAFNRFNPTEEEVSQVLSDYLGGFDCLVKTVK